MAGLQVLIQAVLVPAILERPDVKGSFSRLRDSYSARHLGPDPAGLLADASAAQEALTQHLQRVPRTRNKARERLRELTSPQVEADIAAWVSSNKGLNVPIPSLHDAVQQSGWLVLSTTLGKHLRALADGGFIEKGPNRTYRAPELPPDPDAIETRMVHLSRWLGSLTRTVLQRFQRTEGSALWVLRMLLRPADYRALVRGVYDEMRAHLDSIARRPLDLSDDEVHEYVLFAPSLMSGPEDFRADPSAEPSWGSDLLLTTVGGDVGVRVGGVSAAEEVLQREVIEALLLAAEAEGVDPKDYISDHYGLKSPNTIQAWRGGRALMANGGQIASAARVNVYRFQIGHVLSKSWPNPLSISRLLEGIRAMDPHGRAPDPAMVELALGQLAAEDLLVRHPGRERSYALQRPDYKDSVEEAEAMREAMGQDLRVVPSMVAAVESAHPAAEVRGGVWCIRRDALPDVKAWLRDVVNRQWLRYSSHLPAPSTQEVVGEEYCGGRLIVQMRVSPIMHVSRR